MAAAVPVGDLRHAFGALRRALEARDAAAIMSATRAVRAAADDLRSAHGGRMAPGLREELEELAPEIDAARVQVNLASDAVRQRLARLAQKGVDSAAPLTYGR